MSYIIAITGDSASGKSTLAGLLKASLPNSLVLECDRYHRWGRGDSQWSSYTHLNPEANLLEKMRQDICDLKNGHNIFKVEYDHENGKFTEIQIERPEENIIVCGLHSFYTDTPLYDLKIFLDTDPQLRVQWKIDRDTSKRNQTKEQVLASIDARRADFERYVLPQRSLADLIINQSPTGLALFIRRRFSIDKILEKLRQEKIEYTVVESIDPDFHILRLAGESFNKHIVEIILFLKGLPV